MSRSSQRRKKQLRRKISAARAAAKVDLREATEAAVRYSRALDVALAGSRKIAADLDDTRRQLSELQERDKELRTFRIHVDKLTERHFGRVLAVHAAFDLDAWRYGLLQIRQPYRWGPGDRGTYPMHIAEMEADRMKRDVLHAVECELRGLDIPVG